MNTGPLSLRLDSTIFARNQESNSRQQEQTAIDCPLRLTRHEATWKNIDSL
jgi:hypothetical protein